MLAYAIFLHFYVQKRYAESPDDKNELVVNSKSELESDSHLTDFLENPINLQAFKARKNRNLVTTSATNGMKYYFNPKFRDSIFYNYNFITENVGPNRVNTLIVFKYGENKHTYEDETETLIEMRIFNKDSDLKKANLVGLSKMQLESRFGTGYLTFDNGIVYSNKNKILILELDNTNVKAFRYIKLNSDKINKDLIGQIME